MTIPDRIIDEAAAWFVRQSDEAMDWAGFTAWLEADSRHREAFDGLCRIDADLDLLPGEAVAAAEAANDPAPARRWGYWAGGGAIAAGLALLLALQPARQGPAAVDYRSAQGQVRDIALADGTRVALAPASRLSVKGSDFQLAGAAYFDVPHRPGRSLTVRAAGLTISDIGTRFEVTNFDEAVGVQVEEGQVSVDAPGVAQPVRLGAGHGLSADNGSIRLTLKPGPIATWRQGKLVFDDVPLALAARDVTRYSGTKITVDPTIGDRRLSGVIAIHDGGTAARDIAQILAVDARPVAGGVRLEPRRR